VGGGRQPASLCARPGPQGAEPDREVHPAHGSSSLPGHPRQRVSGPPRHLQVTGDDSLPPTLGRTPTRWRDRVEGAHGSSSHDAYGRSHEIGTGQRPPMICRRGRSRLSPSSQSSGPSWALHAIGPKVRFDFGGCRVTVTRTSPPPLNLLARGTPAAPWHSRTVTRAEPPLVVIVLTIVTWQIGPRPPVLSTPLLQVVVGPIVAAAVLLASAREPRSRTGSLLDHGDQPDQAGHCRDLVQQLDQWWGRHAPLQRPDNEQLRRSQRRFDGRHGEPVRRLGRRDHGRCDPFPATTTGAAITQCNGSANGGTLVGLTCTAPGTKSAAHGVTINQCNGSANGCGALVICSASIANRVVAPAPLRPRRRQPPWPSRCPSRSNGHRSGHWRARQVSDTR